MVTVTVSPIQTINVRVNPQNQQIVSSSVQFIGSNSAQAQIQEAFALANAAFIQANTALTEVNSAYNLANNALPLTGGTITGGLDVTGNVITQSDFVGIIDAGGF